MIHAESYNLGLLAAARARRSRAWPVRICAGCAEEIIEDGVQEFLLDPGDTETLHDRLDRLLRDAALRQEMGRRARARVAERFLDAPVAARLASLLARATGTRA